MSKGPAEYTVIIEEIGGPIELKVKSNGRGRITFGMGRNLITGQRKFKLNDDFASRIFKAIWLIRLQRNHNE